MGAWKRSWVPSGMVCMHVGGVCAIFHYPFLRGAHTVVAMIGNTRVARKGGLCFTGEAYVVRALDTIPTMPLSLRFLSFCNSFLLLLCEILA